MTDDPGTLGLGRREVRLVPHDPRWAADYRHEAARLRQALGAHALEIAHIGSTAVPGLLAKPLLDIMVGIPALADGERLVSLLAAIGYEHRPHDALPDRHFFIAGEPDARRVNLSLVAWQGSFWRDHLAFRDILRDQPEVASAYAHLKLDLAGQFATDRLAYTEAKGEFVAEVLARLGADEGQAGTG